MGRLEDIRFIKSIDKSDILKYLLEFPGQCEDAFKIGMALKLERPAIRIDNIIFAGMGGSSIGGDIIKGYLQNEVKIPISVCRDYVLPAFVSNNTLLFCLSYSGNTEETVSLFEEGMKRGAVTIAIGSGGRLKQMALEKGASYVDIPKGFLPRTALGYLSIILLEILSKFGIIEDKGKDIRELIDALLDIRDKELNPDIPADKNLAKKIAVKMYNRFCVLYVTSITEAIGSRWRSQIAENAKTLSSCNMFPEMAHNEICGWKFPRNILRNFTVILIKDKDDFKRTKLKMEISRDIITRSGAKVIEVERPNGSLLSRLYSLIYIGDFVSFYLAILNKVDPTNIDSIEYFKQELAKIKI